MALTLHVSTVAEAKAAIQELENYIERERAKDNDPQGIDVLGLPVVASNKLQAAGITTVGQLSALSWDELWEAAKIGRKSFNEITAALAKLRQNE